MASLPGRAAAAVGRECIGDAVELRVLITGLTIFLVATVVLTLLGLGGAAGNGAGLLFWMLLAVLAVALVLSLMRSRDEEVVRLSRRVRDHERR